MSNIVKNDIGIIGMGVMGLNIALNVADKGFSVSVYNRTFSKTEKAIERAKKDGKGKFKFYGYKEISEFVKSLKTPKSVIILVKAGKAVEGDIIIDGGNEWFENTENRIKKVNGKGLLYLGMGVSGGEKGARYGPSMMPGGNEKAYKQNEKILLKIAAQVKNEPCVTYIGKGGSGNYVKMVHNGIEYGDMQLICEVYDIMKNFGFTNNEISKIFEKWNSEELQSYLIEITYKIMKKKDKDGGEIVDKILDQSGSKGTGMWTVQNAAKRGMPVPTIAGALFARYISSFKDERVEASKKLKGPSIKSKINKEKLIIDLKNALYASKICSYAQGMSLIAKASKDFNWDLRLGKIAQIWRGGCIIRAVFLDRITQAYEKNKKLKNLLMNDEFANEIMNKQDSWREVICLAVKNGIPVPSLSASLSYYDSYRRDRLPANLIQAQRDFFGSHTFKRIDKDGDFHVEWEQ